MNKSIVKIVSILFVVLVIISFNMSVFATTGSNLTNMFDGEGGTDVSKGETILTKVIGPILSVIRIVATGVSIIMITFLGIKYMSAAPSEKANIKNQLITFTIGAVVVVGTTSILELIKDFATTTFE